MFCIYGLEVLKRVGKALNPCPPPMENEGAKWVIENNRRRNKAILDLHVDDGEDKIEKFKVKANHNYILFREKDTENLLCVCVCTGYIGYNTIHLTFGLCFGPLIWAHPPDLAPYLHPPTPFRPGPCSPDRAVSLYRRNSYFLVCFLLRRHIHGGTVTKVPESHRHTQTHIHTHTTAAQCCVPRPAGIRRLRCRRYQDSNTPHRINDNSKEDVLFRTDALAMRLLEMGKLSPAMQQGVPNGRDVRAEAGLRHQLQARQVQAVRPNREEAAAV